MISPRVYGVQCRLMQCRQLLHAEADEAGDDVRRDGLLRCIEQVDALMYACAVLREEEAT